MSSTKGTRSKTHRGRKNFTTKKGNKVFNPRSHYVTKSYRPFSYHKGSKSKTHRGKRNFMSRRRRGGSKLSKKNLKADMKQELASMCAYRKYGKQNADCRKYTQRIKKERQRRVPTSFKKFEDNVQEITGMKQKCYKALDKRGHRCTAQENAKFFAPMKVALNKI
jgi:hypothetical protein